VQKDGEHSGDGKIANLCYSVRQQNSQVPAAFLAIILLKRKLKFRIVAVAAREKGKAEQFASDFDIPKVK
jgi:hypothetical protein